RPLGTRQDAGAAGLHHRVHPHLWRDRGPQHDRRLPHEAGAVMDMFYVWVGITIVVAGAVNMVRLVLDSHIHNPQKLANACVVVLWALNYTKRVLEVAYA